MCTLLWGSPGHRDLLTRVMIPEGWRVVVYSRLLSPSTCSVWGTSRKMCWDCEKKCHTVERLPHAVGSRRSSQQPGKPSMAASRESWNPVSLESLCKGTDIWQRNRYSPSNDAVSWVASWSYLFLLRTSFMGLKTTLYRNKGGGMDWESVGEIIGVGFWLMLEWTGFADGLVWEWVREGFQPETGRRELPLAETGKMWLKQANSVLGVLYTRCCVWRLGKGFVLPTNLKMKSES